MESREALRICSQALPGRDTGRTDLDGMKPPHSRQGAEPKGICSLCHMANVGFGAKPRKWVKGLVPCGVQGQSPCPAEHNSIYGENTGQILETRALRQE